MSAQSVLKRRELLDLIMEISHSNFALRSDHHAAGYAKLLIHGALHQDPKVIIQLLKNIVGQSKRRWGRFLKDALEDKALVELKGYDKPTYMLPIVDKWLVRDRRQAIPQRLRDEIFNKASGACSYCNIELTTNEPHAETHFHVDHVVPVATGGGNEPDNLVAACRRCNLAKGAKEDWIRREA